MKKVKVGERRKREIDKRRMQTSKQQERKRTTKSKGE
jgi:hypothetical protein